MSPDTEMIVIVLLVGLTAIVLWTRMKRYWRSRKSSFGSAVPVPLVPYWLPFLGHGLDLAFQPDKLLKGTRDSSPHGAFCIVLGSSIHNMIYTPSLTQALLSQRSSVLDFHSIIWQILENIGGVSKRYKKAYEDAIGALNAAVMNNLLREPQLGTMVGMTVRNLEENVPNLVSFSASPVDQTSWEKCSGARHVVLSENISAMEVSLLPLIINFVGTSALPSVFGSDFPRNYPGILMDLWTFNHGFLQLAAGLPRWIPIPSLGKAYAARARLIDALSDFHHALDAYTDGLDPGSEWSSIDDVSELLKARHKIYRSHCIPPHVRAPGDLAILWALNANSNFLVFWLLLRICSEPSLLRRVQYEIKPYVHITTPSLDFGVPTVPRIKIDEKGLATACPLLKSCYIESLRLDSAPWSVRKVLKDFTITESHGDAAIAGEQPATFVLKEGTYADVPWDLHFTDPRYFRDPELYLPERHVKEHSTSSGVNKGEGTQHADWGTVRPYGGGSSICKGRLFAEKEVLACIAGLLTMWEFEPLDPAGWTLPAHGKATGVAMPLTDVRVRIRRREL